MTDEPRKEQLHEWYSEEYFRRYPRHDRRIRRIVENLEFNRGDRVCEFGCGLGHILLALRDRIGYGLGIDFSEYAVGEAGRAARELDAGNLTFAALDLETLVFRSDLEGSFDTVLMMDISEHLYDETLCRVLRSARHILTPKGNLYLHTPNAGYFLERMKKRNLILPQFPSHVAVRNRDQYDVLLRQEGFVLAECRYLPHYHPLLGVIDRVMSHFPPFQELFRARLLIRAVPR